MTPIGLLTAIGGTKSLSTLDGFARTIWQPLGAREVTDEQARRWRRLWRAASAKCAGSTPLRTGAACGGAGERRAAQPFSAQAEAVALARPAASIERRRTLAASGPMPPQLASQFTTGELAVLRLVADEARAKRHCALTLGELAARAGVGITTARNAIYEAAGHGYLTIEERRRDKRPNLSNVVRIVRANGFSGSSAAEKPSKGRGNAEAYVPKGEDPKKWVHG